MFGCGQQLQINSLFFFEKKLLLLAMSNKLAQRLGDGANSKIVGCLWIRLKRARQLPTAFSKLLSLFES
jgi:hypothetical protein